MTTIKPIITNADINSMVAATSTIGRLSTPAHTQFVTKYQTIAMAKMQGEQ